MDIYIGTQSEYTKENVAIVEAIKLLAKTNTAKFLKVYYNIEIPDFWNGRNRQIDLLIIKPNKVLLFDFKECAEPVVYSENNEWLIQLGYNEKEVLKGGGSKNPFHQLKHTGTSLIKHIESNLQKSTDDLKGILSSGVVFTPQLNPNSKCAEGEDKFPPPWFSILGLNELPHYVFTNSSKRNLSSSEVEKLTRSFNCRIWDEVYALVPQPNNQILTLTNLTDNSQRNFSVNNETFSIGRGPDNDLVISEKFNAVSRYHLTLTNIGGAIYIIDGNPKRGKKNSSFGIFINNKRVPAGERFKLYSRDVVSFGNKEGQSQTFKLTVRQANDESETTTTIYTGNPGVGDNDKNPNNNRFDEEQLKKLLANYKIRFWGPQTYTQELSLNSISNIYGRSTNMKGTDVKTDDMKMSRTHFCIHAHLDNSGKIIFEIEDKKSTNGTIVNDREIHSKTRIEPNSRFQIGQTFGKIVEKDKQLI